LRFTDLYGADSAAEPMGAAEPVQGGAQVPENQPGLKNV
jgi:hypothetical protein